jgi:phage terminase large subunit
MFRTLLGSNRTSNSSIKARAILTGNPGGVGHGWLKRLFVERRFNERERPQDYTFIQALVDDNPALMENDPNYVHRLESEPNEAIRMAFRYGSWDIFAGQYFNEIERTVHFIRPFTIPHHWNRFGAYDYGFNHPAAFGYFAVDEDGSVYLYREVVEAKKRVDEFARLLKKYPDTEKLGYIVAGWDCWANKGTLNQGSSPTIAEEFLKHDIRLSRAKIDRVQGAAQVRAFLAHRNHANGTGKPRFYIFDNCPIAFDTLSRMEHDPNHVEDVLKVDAVDGDPLSGDDTYDMVRYGLMSRPMLSEAPRFQGEIHSKEWLNYQSQLIEKSINQQIEKEQADERGQDLFNIADLGLDDNPASYFINKRRK